jgi:hypothetical protein
MQEKSDYSSGMSIAEQAWVHSQEQSVESAPAFLAAQ